MQGFQLIFYTQQGVRHGSRPLGEWLMEKTNSMGISGATLVAASEGFGHAHKIHAARFLELADQPIEITMAVSEEEADRLFQLFREENIDIFYIKIPVEYGMTGQSWG